MRKLCEHLSWSYEVSFDFSGGDVVEFCVMYKNLSFSYSCFLSSVNSSSYLLSKHGTIFIGIKVLSYYHVMFNQSY